MYNMDEWNNASPEKTDCPQNKHRKYLDSCALALTQIQGVIYRLEEAYHDETNSYGNLYRGLDALLDAKFTGPGGSGVGGSASLGGSTLPVVPGNNVTSTVASGVNTGGTKRRLTQEDRWFSQSCGIAPPNARPSVGRRAKFPNGMSFVESYSTHSSENSTSPACVAGIYLPYLSVNVQKDLEPKLEAQTSHPALPSQHLETNDDTSFTNVINTNS